MPSDAIDADVSGVPRPPRSPALWQLAGAASRLVLAGHPRAAQVTSPQAELAVQRPKEVLLALVAALAEAEGLETQRLNPHFTAVADWHGGLAVAHFGQLELTCPLPLARNALLLDGEDLLALADERRGEGDTGLHRRRALLMDEVLSVAPPRAAGPLLPEGRTRPAPMPALLGQASRLLAAARRGRAAQPGPVQWMPCDLETGHYNFLELRRHPRLGSSHARVLLDPALRRGQRTLIGFATPGTLGELGPALRAFAALRGTGGETTTGPRFFVFFFGGPEDFSSAVAARPDALFFGDNFRCPSIRFLFAPFSALDLLEAVQGAAATIDTCYGGVLGALAEGMGVANRIMLGPDGGLEAEGAAGAPGIDWEAVLSPGVLARRRQKADRAGERALVATLEAML